MTAAALKHDAFAPQSPPGMRSGFGLAVAAHVLLVLALAWSINWKASEPEGVVAELWSALPQTAAPRLAAPEPRPPVAEPEPAPPPSRPEPAPPPAPPREDAQIAVERAAREKERRVETERAELAKQAEKKRRDEMRRVQEQQRDEQQKQRLAEEQAEKKRQAEQARKDETRQAAIREANLKRMMSQAGSSDEPGSTGIAARTSGPSAGYAGRIKARIKPNIVLTAAVAGNPTTEVEVRVAPDGTIVGRKITKSGGSATWDDAVLRAIDKTEVLPRDVDGRVPPVMSMTFRPIE